MDFSDGQKLLHYCNNFCINNGYGLYQYLKLNGNDALNNCRLSYISVHHPLVKPCYSLNKLLNRLFFFMFLFAHFAQIAINKSYIFILKTIYQLLQYIIVSIHNNCNLIISNSENRILTVLYNFTILL